jgi:iron-sulfur cluster repair protein YtfE (RIC family)
MAEIKPDVTRAAKLKKAKKEAKKIRRELGGVLIVLARLDKKRAALNVNPDLDAALVRWHELLSERVKLLKATAEKIEQLPDVIASCPEIKKRFLL